MSTVPSVHRADIAALLFGFLALEVLAAAIVTLAGPVLPSVVYSLFRYVPPVILALAAFAAVAALPHRIPAVMLAITTLAFGLNQLSPIRPSGFEVALKIGYAVTLLALAMQWLRVRRSESPGAAV